MLNKDNIICFWRETEENGVYSQWYKSEMIIDGIKYLYCEQYMMHQKAILFKDYEIAKEIMKADNPSDMKVLGRKVKNFNQKIWDENKEEIVYIANINKFSQNEKLKTELLNTGNKTIIETSPYDKIWGIGLTRFDKRVLDTSQWKGQNLLGKAIMKVRDELRK